MTEPGIAERPAVPPEILAVLAAAVDQAWPRPVRMTPPDTNITPAWRFSGRWWTKSTPTRRDRPGF